MAGRRRRTTPYEVMGRGRREPAAAPEPPPAPEPAPASASEASESFSPTRWLAGLSGGTPIVLRLPRGMAVAICVAILGLIVMAYWVGHSRGFTAGEHYVVEAREQGEPAPRGAPDEVPGQNGGAGGQAQASLSPGPSQAEAAAEGVRGAAEEPESLSTEMQEGLGYLVVATYPHDEAERLREFLEGQGVAATVERYDNNRSRVRCLRGISPNATGDREEFRRRLVELGRQWRSDERGPTNLSDAYWAPY